MEETMQRLNQQFPILDGKVDLINNNKIDRKLTFKIFSSSMNPRVKLTALIFPFYRNN
jgi:hypothetical protein